MEKEKYNFSIIFDELDKLTKDQAIQVTKDEIKEYDEIQALREIVIETQTPPKTFISST